MTDVNNKRKIFVVDRAFQMNFVLKFCFIVFITSISVGGFLFYLTRYSLAVPQEVTTEGSLQTATTLISSLLLGTILIVTALSALVVFVMASVVAHRIAGPLHRLKMEADLFREGDVSRRFQIRTRDEFQDLSKSLGDMAQTVKGQCVEIKARVQGLRQFLAEKELSLSPEDKAVLKRKLDEVQSAVDYFHVSPKPPADSQ